MGFCFRRPLILLLQHALVHLFNLKSHGSLNHVLHLSRYLLFCLLFLGHNIFLLDEPLISGYGMGHKPGMVYSQNVLYLRYSVGVNIIC